MCGRRPVDAAWSTGRGTRVVGCRGGTKFAMGQAKAYPTPHGYTAGSGSAVASRSSGRMGQGVERCRAHAAVHQSMCRISRGAVRRNTEALSMRHVHSGGGGRARVQLQGTDGRGMMATPTISTRRRPFQACPQESETTARPMSPRPNAGKLAAPFKKPACGKYKVAQQRCQTSLNGRTTPERMAARPRHPQASLVCHRFASAQPRYRCTHSRCLNYESQMTVRAANAARSSVHGEANGHGLASRTSLKPVGTLVLQ